MTSTSPPTPPTPPPPNPPGDDDALGPLLPPHDELDAMLRQWHRDNADKAAAGRDRLLASLSHEDGAADRDALHRVDPKPEVSPGEHGGPIVVLRRIFVNRYAPLAAAAVLVAAVLPFLLPGKSGVINTGLAKGPTNVVMAPEGARLDAFDSDGNLLGPCTLSHTDVNAEISGRFARVTVKQQYRNSGPDKIEAVYTFPLGEQSIVDRLRMTTGERIITGEARERDQARRMYEQARSSGRTASVLERERPNIFTQSVTNVEPGAAVDIELSYVEPIQEREGEYSFVFPTALGPRFIPESPGSRPTEVSSLPAGVSPRRGLVLDAPATVSNATVHDGPGQRTSEQLGWMLEKATPIAEPPETAALPTLWYDLTVAYPDGSAEPAKLLADGRGCVGGRWFYCPPTPPTPPDAAPTGRAAEAERLSPTLKNPDTRSGQDISVSVLLDTGGPAITALESPHHELNRTDLARTDAGLPNRVSLALANHAEIPNRDFVLTWTQRSEHIASRVLTHTGKSGDFFCVQLDAPTAIKDPEAVARELFFLVDTSSAMDGRPRALCKDVVHKAIGGMRPQDTFNIVSFNAQAGALWDRPRPSTPDTRAEADRFIDTWQGARLVDDMAAFDAALGSAADVSKDSGTRPIRIVVLVTGGQVANDVALLDAVKRAGTATRVFPFRIGAEVNQALIEQLALAGRGEPEYLSALPADPSDEQAASAIDRFARRFRTAILTGVTATFSGVQVTDVLPDPASSQDLFDTQPITLLGRYAAPGAGSITFTGHSAQGPWSRTVPIQLPAKQPGGGNSSLPTLWAGAQIDALMAQDVQGALSGQVRPDIRGRIIDLAESFNIASPFTSMVAVDTLRLTVEGKSRLIRVPVERPDQTNWTGVFVETPTLAEYKEGAAGRTVGVEPFQKNERALTLKEDVIGKLVTSSNAPSSPPTPTLAQAPAARSASPADEYRAAGRAAPPPAPALAPSADGKGTAAPTAMPSTAPTAKRTVDLQDKPVPTAGAYDTDKVPSPAPPPAEAAADAKPAAPATVTPIVTADASEHRPDPAFYRQSNIPEGRDRAYTFGSPHALNLFDATPYTAGSAGNSNAGNDRWRGEPYGSPAAPVRSSTESQKNLGLAFDALQGNDTTNSTSAGLQVLQADQAQNFADSPIERENLVTLAAAQLAQSGRVDDAKRLACSNTSSANLLANTDANATYRASVQQNISQPALDRLCGCLSGDLPAAERDAAVEEARVQASAQIRDGLRAETLARKLGPEAFAVSKAGARNGAYFAEDSRSLADTGVAAPGPSALPPPPAPAALSSSASSAPPPAPVAGELNKDGATSSLAPHVKTLLLAILLADTSAQTLDAVKALGAKIEAVAPGVNVIVARLPIDKLEDLALMDAVRRVELVPPERSTPPAR